MSEDELRTWFNEIAGQLPRGAVQDGSGLTASATRFIADAESAIRAAFPGEHPLCQQWTRAYAALSTAPVGLTAAKHEKFSMLRGVFDSAHGQLMAGRRGSFTSIVRRAAEEDLLAVAEVLIEEGYRAAAAVTAGGALEVHLRGLCERGGIAWPGKGQIENYKAALEREHKTNPTKGIGTTDAKLVTGWGGLRNDAAHQPDEFPKNRTTDEVRVMIAGIREFIARTT